MNERLRATHREIRAWSATVDVVTAGRAFGMGRTKAYDMAKRGTFPVPVLPVGGRLRVRRADVMANLGISEESATEVKS